MGNAEIWPETTPEPLKRSSPNLACVITSWIPFTKNFSFPQILPAVDVSHPPDCLPGHRLLPFFSSSSDFCFSFISLFFIFPHAGYFSGFHRLLGARYILLFRIVFKGVIQHCERILSLALAETCWAIMPNVQPNLNPLVYRPNQKPLGSNRTDNIKCRSL